MKEKLFHEVYKKISEKNSFESPDAIPHSDIFFRELESMMGIPRLDIKNIIRILHDSHYIMIIEIVKEDRSHDVKRVEGYVCAELPVIRRLKNYYHMQLQQEYSKMFGKQQMAQYIIKQLFPNIRQYNNLPLGHILNKSLMLVEFENLIEKEFSQYTDEWKENKLRELIILQEAEYRKDSQATGQGPSQEPDVRRAVDSGSYNEYNEDRGRCSSKKLLQIYGFDFFIRVNLRKYNFKLICEAVDRGYIAKKAELRRLKEMIHKIRQNMDIDTELHNHEQMIATLERSVSRAIARSVY